MSESEWKTRKARIDPKLDACAWRLAAPGTTAIRRPYRTEEEETDNGPADYATAPRVGALATQWANAAGVWAAARVAPTPPLMAGV